MRQFEVPMKASNGDQLGNFDTAGTAPARPEVDDKRHALVALGAENGARAQFHQHGEGGDFPEHHLGPGALECKLVLVAPAFEVVGRQAQLLEPFHEG